MPKILRYSMQEKCQVKLQYHAKQIEFFGDHFAVLFHARDDESNFFSMGSPKSEQKGEDDFMTAVGEDLEVMKDSKPEPSPLLEDKPTETKKTSTEENKFSWEGKPQLV